MYSEVMTQLLCRGDWTDKVWEQSVIDLGESYMMENMPKYNTGDAHFAA